MNLTSKAKLAVVFVAVSGAALAIIHCGGSSDNTTNSDAGTTADSGASSSGTSGTSGTSGSSGSSGEGGTDSGTSGGIPEGGAPSNPGAVVCGATLCDAGTDEGCCVPNFGDAGDHCANGTAPTSCGVDTREACDEAADCDASVCCQTFSNVGGGSVGAASCRVALADGGCPTQGVGPGSTDTQLCRTDAECKNKLPCQVTYCGTRPIQACGLVTCK